MTEDTIKAIQVIKSLDVGGVEELLLTLSNNLDDDIDLTIVTLRNKGQIGREIEQSGTTVINMERPSGITPWNAVGTVRALHQLFDRLNPDIVHSYLWESNFYSRIAAMTCRVPVVVTSEQNIYPDKQFRHIAFDKLLSYVTDRIVACSESVKEFTARQEHIPEQKFTVIYNAIDPDKFEPDRDREEVLLELGIDPDATVLISVGSLSKQKGHQYLIRALAMMEDDIDLLIAGSGGLESDLRGLAADLGTADRVHLLGKRRDIPDLLEAGDVFVFPSLWEGLPIALVEALEMKLPVVASDIAPNREVVQDDAGVLVPPRDPEALAEGIQKLLNEPERAREFAETGQQRVAEQFSVETLVADYRTLYRDLLERSTR
jgi:glycosyltransferase involved in cell wall biosynthesis